MGFDALKNTGHKCPLFNKSITNYRIIEEGIYSYSQSLGNFLNPPNMRVILFKGECDMKTKGAEQRKQPHKCRGCPWGKWVGKQFCSLPSCVKSGGKT